MTSDSLHAFTDWLSRTPPSLVIQNVTWIVPAVQTVHIACIAIVMGAMVMLDFRILGLAGRGQPLSVLINRLMPWVWWALIVLLLTGAALITGEPARSLENPAFQLKMVLLLCACALVLTVERGVRTDSAFWDMKPSRKTAAKIIAIASLFLFAAIVFAGRWIAYFEVY